MSFVQINIAPVAAPVSTPGMAYRAAIARIAAAASAGEDIEDQVAAIASAFDLDTTSIQAEVDEVLPDVLPN